MTTADDEPQPRDWVRVTIDSVVNEDGNYRGQTFVDGGAKVEIIWRAAREEDDPERSLALCGKCKISTDDGSCIRCGWTSHSLTLGVTE